MTKNVKLENGRIICTPQSTLVANEKATTLSLSSSTEEIKRYFKAILELSKLDVPYPVNLDSCWMLCYSEKGKATRALKENFIEGIDYQCLAQNGKTATGGYRTIEYHLSVSCLEYFIARKVRPVFDVYREVFHKTVEVLPKVAKSCQSDKRKIARLEAEIEKLEEQLEWTRWSERREIELKCACFSYLVETKQYDKMVEHRERKAAERMKRELGLI